MPVNRRDRTTSLLFSAGFPVLFTLTAALLVRDILLVPGPGALAIVLVIAGSISYHAVSARLENYANARLARLRAFLVMLLVSYAALALTRSGPLVTRVIPDLLHAWRLVLVVTAWSLSAALFTIIADRNAMLRIVYEQRTAERREQVLREMSDVTAESMARFRSLRRLLSALFVLLVIVMLIAWPAGRTPSMLSLVLLILLAIARYLTSATIESFLDEYRYVGDGNRLPARYRMRRLRHAAALLLLSALFAFAVAGERTILPPDTLMRLAGFLEGLFPALELEAEMPTIDRAPPTETIEELRRDFMPDDEPPEPPAWIDWVIVFLRRLALTGAISAVAVFLLSPLFTREIRRKLRRFRLREALDLWLAALRKRVSYLTRLFRFLSLARERRGTLRSGSPRRRPASEKSDSSAVSESFTERRRLARISQRFARFSKWARRNGFARRESEAPREFADRIAAHEPEVAEFVRTFTDRYEQALFGGRPLSDEGTREMNDALRTVLRFRLER